jgi:hypothetical protein
MLLPLAALMMFLWSVWYIGQIVEGFIIIIYITSIRETFTLKLRYKILKSWF